MKECKVTVSEEYPTATNIDKHQVSKSNHPKESKTFGKLFGSLGRKFESPGLSKLVLCTPNVADKSRRSVESCSASATRLGIKSRTGKGKLNE